MRGLDRIGFGLLLLAGVLVIAGEYLAAPWMYRAALIAIGLMGCVGGIRTIRKGEVVGGFYEANYLERLSGVSAWLMGGILLLAGIVIAALGSLDLYTGGQAGAIVARLVFGSPRAAGAALALAGLIVLAFGLTRILSGSAKASGSFAPHVELSFRAAGLAASLVGLALLAAGLGLAMAPDLVAGLLLGVSSAARGAIPRSLP